MAYFSFRAFSKHEEKSDTEEFAEIVSHCLFDPFEVWMDSEDDLEFNHLTILVDSLLASLPLSLASFTYGNVLEEFSISLCGGLYQLSQSKQTTGELSSLAAISNPLTSVGDLKCAAIECAAVKSWFPTEEVEVLSEQDANLPNTLKALHQKAIWHFACTEFCFTVNGSAKLLL